MNSGGPTLSLIIFLIQGHNLQQNNIYLLLHGTQSEKHHDSISYNKDKKNALRQLITYFPNSGRRNHHVARIFPGSCQEYAQSAISIPVARS